MHWLFLDPLKKIKVSKCGSYSLTQHMLTQRDTLMIFVLGLPLERRQLF